MSDLKAILLQLHNNLNILLEREAKYAGNAPLDLLNQIDDHKKAIALTQQAIAGEITEDEWQQEIETLLVFTDGQVVKIKIESDTLIIGDQHIHLAPEPSPGPPNTRFWRWTVAVGLLIAIVAGVVQITGIDMQDVGSLFAPAPFPSATDDETLIVIATFHETNATRTEPHVKIKRAIAEAAKEVGLASLRVEIDPTELTADQQEEAKNLGAQHNASVVIWGEDTGVQVLVNFLNLKEPDFNAAYVEIDERQRIQISNPSAYARFITSDLPAELTFLSLFAVGQSYYIQAEYPVAIKVIEKAVDSLPLEIVSLTGTSEAYFHLGWLYQVSASDLESATRYYNKAIDLDPKSAVAYNNRGIVYYGLGEFKKAISDFDHVIALDPNYAVAYHNRGLSYLSLGESDLALDDLSRAIELGRDGTEVYNDRGIAYYDTGNFQLALNDFGRAIELDPKNVGAYRNRGSAYSSLGRFDEAFVDFGKALELNPDFADAYNDLCWIGSLTGKPAEVMDACEHAVELAPEEFAFRDSRGVARALTDDITGALDDFRYVVTSLEEDNEYETYRLKRETWISELEKGNDPFNQSTLQELLSE